jgi:hypothetical protein
MSNGIRILSVIGFLVFLSFKSSDAFWITRNFCIEVVSVRLTYFQGGPDITNDVNIWDHSHGTPGEIYWGSISYDHKNIPSTGTFTKEYWGNQPAGDLTSDSELSLWYESPFLGSKNLHYLDGPYDGTSRLYFSNGSLSGFNIQNHIDLEYWIEDEYISNDHYFGWGAIPYLFTDPVYGDFYDFASCYVRGTVHFPVSVPEPGFIHLCIIGISSILIVRRKIDSLMNLL